MSIKGIKFLPNTSFLVTGGAGFIGSNLCEAILKLGYKVTCLDNLSNGNIENIQLFFDNERFKFIKGDICDLDTCLDACKGIDFVLHQAAWGSVPRSIEMPLFYERVNIMGTLNMLEAARTNNVKAFVYASSSSVYGDSEELPKIEGREGQPLSPYALTKSVDEKYAKLYSKIYGLKTVGLRYFNVFGRRQDPNGSYAAVIPKFIKSFSEGNRIVIFGDGMQSRDFTYIDNVIEANLKACFSPLLTSGKAYNIAYGDRITLLDFHKLLCDAFKIDLEPIFEKPRAGDVKHSKADITAARNDLGYDPSFNFLKGLKLTIEWYLNNKV